MTEVVRETGLPPIARSDARLFILGSLPGNASFAAHRYYAHSTNQFWGLPGVRSVRSCRHSNTTPAGAARGRRIGLWDVIASASRRGSLDQAIREAEHNRIEHLLHDFPDLRAIAFNGSTARRSAAS